jgi:hypothetical protein
MASFGGMSLSGLKVINAKQDIRSISSKKPIAILIEVEVTVNTLKVHDVQKDLPAVCES